MKMKELEISSVKKAMLRHKAEKLLDFEIPEEMQHLMDNSAMKKVYKINTEAALDVLGCALYKSIPEQAVSALAETLRWSEGFLLGQCILGKTYESISNFSDLLECAVDVINYNPSNLNMWHSLLLMFHKCVETQNKYELATNKIISADFIKNVRSNIESQDVTELREWIQQIENICRFQNAGFQKQQAVNLARMMNRKDKSLDTQKVLFEVLTNANMLKTDQERELFIKSIERDSPDLLQCLIHEAPKVECEKMLQDVQIIRKANKSSVDIQKHFLSIEDLKKYSPSAATVFSPTCAGYWLKDGYVQVERKSPDESKGTEKIYTLKEYEKRPERRPKGSGLLINGMRPAYKFSKQIAPIGADVVVDGVDCIMVDKLLAISNSIWWITRKKEMVSLSYTEAEKQCTGKIPQAEYPKMNVTYELTDVAIEGYGFLGTKDYMQYSNKIPLLSDTRSWWLAEGSIYVDGDKDGAIHVNGAFGNPKFYLRPVLYYNPEYSTIPSGGCITINNIDFTVIPDRNILVTNDATMTCHNEDKWAELDKWVKENLDITAIRTKEQGNTDQQVDGLELEER